jgi:PAS domain S-box-containing protein
LRSVQQYFVVIALLLMLLVIAATALILYEVDGYGRAQSERQLLATTRALSLVVDGELKRDEAILTVLAATESVARGDWDALDRRARQLAKGPDNWILLSDRSGRQLVNTRLPRGASLPSGPPPADWDELENGRSRICNLSRGQIEAQILCVDVPIIRDGKVAYVLSMVMRPAQLGNILAQQRLQPESFTTILDRNEIVVWRNRAAERFIGKPATNDMQSALSRTSEGILISRSLEGTPTVAAYSRSSLSGWTFIIGIPQSVMREGTRRAFIFATVGAAFCLILAALIGLLAGRRVTSAVKRLSTSVDQIGSGLMPTFEPSGLKEIDSAGQALVEALHAKRLSEDRYGLIFQQTSDLILTADLDQVITDCNPSAAAAVGVSREQAIGRNISEFVSPDDYDRTSTMLEDKLNGGGTTQYDVRVKSRTGEWLHWEINSGLTRDADGMPKGLYVVGRDITERKRAEERQRLLINELNHRVKNTLAIVQALAQQSLKGKAPPAEERAAFEARLLTLAAAHNLLTRETWERVSLAEIIEIAVKAASGTGDDRFEIKGPDVNLKPQTAVSMAMAVHELCTNAIKYGALSTDSGRIIVKWSVAEDEGKRRLRLEWIERGGPPVEPPARQGFGTRMIERGLAAEMMADVQLDFQPDGLVCIVEAPLDRNED